MSVIIRPALLSDLPSVLKIINYEILNTTSIYDYEPRNLEQQTAIFHHKKESHFPFLIAILNDEVVGFGTYGQFRIKEGNQFTVEHSVYVAVNYTGRGIGKMLLEELIAIAKKQKMHTMIGVIDSENQDSIAFHEKHGFKIVGTIKESGYKFNRWLDTVFVQLFLK